MDRRSTTAQQYRGEYQTKQWHPLRRRVLVRDNFRCNHCGVILTNGRCYPRSAVVHHKMPHKGNLDLFYDQSNLEAVCWRCHSGSIQSKEALGYDTTIGADGWPVDGNHPSVR